MKNDGKVTKNYSQLHLLSVSMRSVGSNSESKPVIVKVKSKIQTIQDLWKIYLLLLVLGIIIVKIMIASDLLWQKRKTNCIRQKINHNEPVYVKTFEPDDNQEIARESVELSNEIDEGNFGKAFEETLKTAEGSIKSVAVKTINEDATLGKSTNFLIEASIMEKFKSIHIVQLLGIVSETKPYLVIMELMANGDLKTFLRKNRPVGGFSTMATATQHFSFIELFRLCVTW